MLLFLFPILSIETNNIYLFSVFSLVFAVGTDFFRLITTFRVFSSIEDGATSFSDCTLGVIVVL